MNSLRIGDVAKRAGVNLETVRFYERKGLLPRPPRARSGYRAFSEDAVRRVRMIKRTQALGFSLKEISELLAIGVDPDGTCADVRQRTMAKLAAIDVKIAELRRMKKALATIAAKCPGSGPSSACPLLESLEDTTSDSGATAAVPSLAPRDRIELRRRAAKATSALAVLNARSSATPVSRDGEAPPCRCSTKDKRRS
jgi:MerR family mercuric resistance operon transcriptional regulator